jgi:spore coat protein U-like protein
MPMTAAGSVAPPARGRARRLPGGLLALAGLLVLLAGPARAQSCFVNGAAGLDFGAVTAAANTDAQSSLNFQCQSGNRGTSHNFRLCVFVGAGLPAGIAPRRMTNFNGALMDYDLYSDPARTLLIGPQGGNFPLYSLVVSVPGSFSSVAGAVPLYGRVPAGQSLPAVFPYLSLPAGSVLRYSYGIANSVPSAEDCRDGVPGLQGGTGSVPFSWSGVRATFDNACRVVVATDLDFGSAGLLAGNRDQTSTIQLQCPSGTAWRVGLDNGVNALGTTRRMASGGSRIAYELYRNAARTQRWGSAADSDVDGTGNNAVQALTVYGRVPAQAAPAPGSYADTVTVTLTY